MHKEIRCKVLCDNGKKLKEEVMSAAWEYLTSSMEDLKKKYAVLQGIEGNSFNNKNNKKQHKENLNIDFGNKTCRQYQIQ